MNLPPFVYSRAFWEALSYALAGLLALLVYFGVVGPEWALSAGAILAFFLTVLKWIGVTPELQAKQVEKNLKKTEKMLDEAIRVRNDLLSEKLVAATRKPKK